MRDLELQMATVIGDEEYRQRANDGRRAVTRLIHAEMLFWWLEDDHVWLSVRNVRTVDKKPVADSDDRLQRAFAAAAQLPHGNEIVSRSARLRALQEESARFDIGRVHRTTSNPTEVLQYLVPENQRQFTFTREREEQMDGARAWKVALREVGRPTVLKFGGVDAPTSGAVWIRTSDGVVLRTERNARMGNGQRFVVTVEFRRDPKLGLWAPQRMEEEYGTLVRCWSEYSNYRHFETSGRIVSPN